MRKPELPKPATSTGDCIVAHFTVCCADYPTAQNCLKVTVTTRRPRVQAGKKHGPAIREAVGAELARLI
jgi:hypothetical protein